MRREFRLPDAGEGLTEAEILGWHVAPGDEVEVNQLIVEVETAKAAVELPSPFAGTVIELLAEPGATVAVGTPIVAIDTAAAGQASTSAAATSAPAPADEQVPNLVGYGPRDTERSGAGAEPRPRRRRSPLLPSHPLRRPRWTATVPSCRWRNRRCASSPGSSGSTCGRSSAPDPAG